MRRYKDIVAIQNGDEFWGYHSGNLQVARLDPSVWNAMATSSESQARKELETWSQEKDTAVTVRETPQSVHSFVINVTQFCNLRCTYCAAGGDGTYGSQKGKVDLTIIKKQLHKFLGDLKEGDSFHMDFFGGEPLLHPEAIESLARYAQLMVAGRNIDLQFSTVTNGTMITPKNAELLARYKVAVTISLDGPPEINDRNRLTVGKTGSSYKVLRGLENLKLVRDQIPSLGVNAVFGDHNMEILESYEYFQKLGFDAINIIYAVTKDDKTASQKYMKELEKVAELAFRTGGEKELRKITIFDHYFDLLDRQQRNINHCTAGKSLLYTDTQGDLYSCSWFIGDESEILGKGTDLFQDRINEYSRPLVEANNCQTCWARFLCGGGCMFVNKETSGNRHKSDPYYCQRMRHTVGLAVRYFGLIREQNKKGDIYETH